MLKSHTPLQAAIGAKKCSCLQLLLKDGADPNTHVDGQVKSAELVFRHSRVERLSLIQPMQDKGAKLDASGRERTTFLPSSGVPGRYCFSEISIRYGLFPAILGHQDQIPLHDCVRWTPTPSADAVMPIEQLTCRADIMPLLISARSKVLFEPNARCIRNQDSCNLPKRRSD